ncbi:MAG: VWA domain-containing protein [Acidobacteriota bacterium]|nr:VWA domain-containing protein [Acidobacteriota bacterium]
MKIYITAIFTLLFAFSAYAQKQAEVIVTSTYLRQSPDISSEKVQTVLKGEKITLEKSRDTNGWYYVSISDGKVKGWIRKDTIGSIVKAEKVPKMLQPTKQPAQTVKETPQKTVAASKTPAPTSQKTVPVPNTERRTLPTPVSVAPPIESATPAAQPAPSPAETPAEVVVEDNEVLRIDTEEVSLNVRVVDGKNRPVGKLDQTQFKVYEDDVLQPITSLTTAEVPTINALVIDNSRSLRSQLKKVIEAGKIIVGANRPNDETAVVRFVSSDKIEVVQDFTSGKNSLDNALDNLFVEGGQTAIIDAVYLTAKKIEQYQNSGKKEDVKIRALILVSDGDDRGSINREQQLFKLLRESQVQIYAVGFSDNLSMEPDENGVSRREKAKGFLTRLAQETGGKVYFPASIDELPQIAIEISGELRTQYLISYSPTNEIRDGAFRKIKVEINDGANKEKRIAITRTGRNSLPK